MNRTVKNLGPPLGALAVVVWLCWPHIMGGQQGVAEQPERLPRIDEQRLCPVLSNTAELDRTDPFAPLPVADSQPALAADQPSADRDRRVVDLSSLAGQLVLNATMVHGGARIAIINNQLYRLGDTVQTPLGGDVALKVAELEVDHVLLVDAEHGSLQLDYDRKDGGRGPAPRPAAQPNLSGRSPQAPSSILTLLRTLIPRGTPSASQLFN